MLSALPHRSQRSPLERFSQRFFHDLTDIPSLASFSGSQTLFRMTRLGILRWVGNTSPAARLLAGVGGLLLEAPAFVVLHRGISRIAKPHSQTEGPLTEEISQTYRTLGAFRLFGSSAQLLLGRGTPPAWLASSLPVAAMYGGIFTASIWNAPAGENRTRDYWALAGDSLATLVQLQATGQLLKAAPGPHHWKGEAPSRPPAVVYNGPLGRFATETLLGVPVFIPLLEGPPPVAPKGTVVLISGLSSNHTRFGELPLLLAKQGWRVRVLAYPGFEVMDANAFLKGFRPRELAAHWQKSIERATVKLAQQHDWRGDFYIGGYSMGGAGAAAFAYGSLPEVFKKRVSGLILAAPSFYSTYFETPNRLQNWFARRVFVPGMSILGASYKKTTSYPSDLGAYMESATVRPWSVDYAAVLLSENARAVVAGFKGEGSLPRLLLVHTGAGDPTVSPKAGAFVKQVFGEKVEREILIPPEDGHYPLVGIHRRTAHEAVLRFVNHETEAPWE
jgi:predicted alpha/beta-hydrolase family hydrolase